jgi:hypothetical protein
VTAVEERQLAHEFIEAAVGREQVAKSHGEQCGRPTRPDEQGKVSQIAPADHSLGNLIGNVHYLFLRIEVMSALLVLFLECGMMGGEYWGSPTPVIPNGAS